MKLENADTDLDQRLAERHEEVAASLEMGRGQIEQGLAEPLETLALLLREARRRGS